MAGKNGKKPELETPDIGLSESQIKKLVDDTERDPLDKAFTAEGGFNAAKAMVELNEELEKNALLLDVPDKRFVVAIKYAYYQYLKHHCDERKQALMVQLGLMASIKGKRVEVFKDTIIGERRNYPFNKNDWGQGIKNFISGENNQK